MAKGILPRAFGEYKALSGDVCENIRKSNKIGLFGSFGEKQSDFFMPKNPPELSIIQKTYDLILWFVPIINRLPRNYKFTLGDRIQNQLYDILEELIFAKYEKDKLGRLEKINGKLDILRYQIKLLLDFKLIEGKKFYYASELLNEIGVELGSWIKQKQI